MRAKLIVFVFAAVAAALSGWLYAHMQRTVNPTPFGLNMGIEYLLMAVIGGAGYIWGAVFGASLVLILKEMLQRVLPGLLGTSGNFEMVVFGILLVLILQNAREGLWPFVLKLLPKTDDPDPPQSEAALPKRDMPATGNTLVQVDQARKQYGGLVAVNDVSFEIKSGEILGLIGPNGAGKSTTFDLITGVQPLTGGRIVLAGHSGGPGRPGDVARQGVARTFQHAKIQPDMTVLENAAMGAHLRGHAGVARSIARLDRAEEAALLAEADRQLARVGLADDRYRKAGDLALGQIRILEIARALALDPTLLLLDEPAAGLRHAEKQQLADLLRRLRADGVSILLVEHDMTFVMGLVDRLVVLDFGSVIASGSPREIRKDPAVIAAYLGGPA